jgi:hypothetical protein
MKLSAWTLGWASLVVGVACAAGPRPTLAPRALVTDRAALAKRQDV